MEFKQSEEGGIFINGKAQIIEMLQFMPAEEREKLVKNLMVKNPTLTKELTQKSFRFSQIAEFNQTQLRMVFSRLAAPVIGLALKGESEETQRYILSSIDRNLAEESFKFMTTSLTNEARDSKRAKEKIIDHVIVLSQRGVINL